MFNAEKARELKPSRYEDIYDKIYSAAKSGVENIDIQAYYKNSEFIDELTHNGFKVELIAEGTEQHYAIYKISW